MVRSSKKDLKAFLVLIIIPLVVILAFLFAQPTKIVAQSADRSQDPNPPNENSSRYIIVGWNNLGMHCYDGDYRDFAVLPPYNTLLAQVIRVGDPPQIITEGIQVQYTFPQNTFSAGKSGRPDKTNFWNYAQDLFNLSSPLPVNVGLTGKGLSGTMDPINDYFIAEGIPLTDIRDQDAVNKKPYPFQLAHLTVIDTQNRNPAQQVLANLDVVAPVSSEFSCINCHCDDCDATTRYPIEPTGGVKTNILTLHDYLNQGKYATPLMDQRPVLCADCHASAALGMPGIPGVKSLSNAMHLHHKDLPDITPDTNGCYNCHPGPTTQCLRDTMSQHFALNCTNCHGTIDTVSQNTQPWLQEPQCSNSGCHGSGYSTGQALYRMSRGHGGLYCSACHDSPHVYPPSREANDGIKFYQLQGENSTLRKCTVCHLTQPDQMFKHSY